MRRGLPGWRSSCSGLHYSTGDTEGLMANVKRLHCHLAFDGKTSMGCSACCDWH
jgi:hypothetical protein